MQAQGSAVRVVAMRPARRFATCSEAMRAVRELELLAEDEVGWLRELGREAEPTGGLTLGSARSTVR